MSRGWKIALAVVGVVIAVNVGLGVLDRLTGGTPGGPASSSYATGAEGAAAYAELLVRAGHPVRRLRVTPSRARLDPHETVVLLGADFVAPADARALHRFVDGGGRLVAGGADPRGWLGRVLESPPRWSSRRVSDPRALAPVPETSGVGRLVTRGGSWSRAGAALPVLGDSHGAVLAVAAVGIGRLLLLADATPLQNGALARGGDARLGLRLAGPARRPVLFLETYHGYGRGSGLASIPARWQTALLLGLLAWLLYTLARARRLGPPEADARELPPPRREYAESLAGVVARSRRRDEALRPVRDRVTELLVRGAALRPDASPEQLREAARRLGLQEDEVDALLGRAASDADVVAVGRALARLERESRP